MSQHLLFISHILLCTKSVMQQNLKFMKISIGTSRVKAGCKTAKVKNVGAFTFHISEHYLLYLVSFNDQGAGLELSCCSVSGDTWFYTLSQSIYGGY